jgi:hypothetical protein
MYVERAEEARNREIACHRSVADVTSLDVTGRHKTSLVVGALILFMCPETKDE